MNFTDVVLLISTICLVCLIFSTIFEIESFFVVFNITCIVTLIILSIIFINWLFSVPPNSRQVFEENNQQYISELNFRKSQPQKFKVGDVVRFKDNPVEMNVVQVNPFEYEIKDFEKRMDTTNYRIVISENVVVKYFDNRNALITATFKEDDLVIIKKENCK